MTPHEWFEVGLVAQRIYNLRPGLYRLVVARDPMIQRIGTLKRRLFGERLADVKLEQLVFKHTGTTVEMVEIETRTTFAGTSYGLGYCRKTSEVLVFADEGDLADVTVRPLERIKRPRTIKDALEVLYGLMVICIAAYQSPGDSETRRQLKEVIEKYTGEKLHE